MWVKYVYMCDLIRIVHSPLLFNIISYFLFYPYMYFNTNMYFHIEYDTLLLLDIGSPD